ncbi:MAG: ribulose-phosphate 3-epimerase [Chloroflexi bacterium]|nr:ribulose-phosphate 3-epimerase [Chloroflexota bacterium]|tara:strand:- start:22895 stop:23575 length:681 start_codon:yes stop_codon:yes gene_type:complete
MNQIKLAPSILSADFSRIGEIVQETESAGADYIHVDVMDGEFVPNLTIGPMVVEAIRAHTNLPLDVHLMIIRPEKLISEFIASGANKITVHREAIDDLLPVVDMIKNLGAKAGVSINPSTPASSIKDILPDLDLVLAMSVNPGFGGQSFIQSVLPKIQLLRIMIDEQQLPIELEVDGGIKFDNVGRAIQAGADVIVAGSAIYNKDFSIQDSLDKMRESILAASDNA